MKRVIVVAALMAMLVTVIAPPAISGPAQGPEQSGAVSRFREPGLQGLFDPAVEVHGAQVPLVAILNVASAEDFCTLTPAGPGDLMVVETASGGRNVLLHDDVPVLLFDVTGLGSGVDDVFPNLRAAACEGLQPIATGSARVRNKVHFNDSNGTFRHVLDASGSVSDGHLVWSLSLHRRARGEIPGPPAPGDIIDSISLAQRGG